MKRSQRFVLIGAGLLTLAMIAMWAMESSEAWRLIDNCRDRGGAWNYEISQCCNTQACMELTL